MTLPHNIDLDTVVVKSHIVENFEYLDEQAAAALFAQDDAATTGLDFGYTAGRTRDGATVTETAAATVALAASDTNYIEVDTVTGAVSANQAGFSADKVPLYEVTTDGSGITSVSDKRTWVTLGGVGGGGVVATGTGFVHITAGVTDGAAKLVENADVDAAAAIAESKLNLASDAAAGTASRRTLGTGATQAAAGNHSHSNATTSVAGFHSAADKLKSDSATANATASTLMMRDSSGNAKVATPSAATDIANKDYVDSVVIAGAADASTTVKGVAMLSVAPDSATDPIAAGTNDPRLSVFTETEDGIMPASGAIQSPVYVSRQDGWGPSPGLDRANHTGTQAQSTITDLVTDLAAKAALATVNTFAEINTFQKYLSLAGNNATTVTADQNDYDLGTATVVAIATDAVRTFRGFVAQPGAHHWLVNRGSHDFIVAYQDAGSTANNRVLVPGAADLTLEPGDAVPIWYDLNANRWRIMLPAPSAGGGASAIDDLTDVVITAPASGEVLTYNGSEWVNDTAASGGTDATAVRFIGYRYH